MTKRRSRDEAGFMEALVALICGLVALGTCVIVVGVQSLGQLGAEHPATGDSSSGAVTLHDRRAGPDPDSSLDPQCVQKVIARYPGYHYSVERGWTSDDASYAAPSMKPDESITAYNYRIDKWKSDMASVVGPIVRAINDACKVVNSPTTSKPTKTPPLTGTYTVVFEGDPTLQSITGTTLDVGFLADGRLSLTMKLPFSLDFSSLGAGTSKDVCTIAVVSPLDSGLGVDGSSDNAVSCTASKPSDTHGRIRGSFQDIQDQTQVHGVVGGGNGEIAFTGSKPAPGGGSP